MAPAHTPIAAIVGALAVANGLRTPPHAALSGSITRAAAASAAAAITAPPRAAIGRRFTTVLMQEEEPPAAATAVADSSVYDEFLATDPKTGERMRIALAEKEKMYLDCLDEYYNSGKQMLRDDDYEQLKQDLAFEGSKVMSFTNKEIKFMIANKRYQMGDPILNDSEYDSLRSELKAIGSTVVLHEAPSCKVDTGVCKMDMRVDNGKQRLLYFPGTVVASLLISEVLFWTVHIDPILSIILGALPAYLFGVYFTENIFAQDPLVVQSACPSCNYLLTAYFGDLFFVQKDGIVGPPTPPQQQIDITCPNCKAALTADREKMIIYTARKPEAAAATAAAG